MAVMEKRKIGIESLERYERFLRSEEKSEATVEKYMRDVRGFVSFVCVGEVSKQSVIDYKQMLGEKHAVAGANSIIAAMNSFLRFCGWGDLCVRQFRVQREAYCPSQKELTRAEYLRLVETARKKKNRRLDLILQTVCGTGIRISELRYITVEAAKEGEAVVSCKGKNRRIFIVPMLRERLLRYAREQGIETGEVFVTRSGRAVNRTNVWREMKMLCREAAVDPRKVFPHNLRHLFARTFYGIEKDIAKLADILGHSSINTTRIYIATTGEEHRRRMENMRLII